jgi:hypothetical protein
MSANARPRHLALPVRDREGNDDGWIVAELPVGNGTPVPARYRGPFARQRAEAKARALSRKGGAA